MFALHQASIAQLSNRPAAQTAPAPAPPPPIVNKIVIYSGESFTGRGVELTDSINNLDIHGFNDQVFSLKVIGAPWVAYCDANYTGKQWLYEQGEYPTLEDKGQFSSLRMITEDLNNPEIQLFEHGYFGGRSVTLKSETNLNNIGFGDTASSHVVIRGVWVLYEHCNRQGNQLVCFPGNVPDYCEIGFNDAMSHARPVLPK